MLMLEPKGLVCFVLVVLNITDIPINFQHEMILLYMNNYFIFYTHADQVYTVLEHLTSAQLTA